MIFGEYLGEVVSNGEYEIIAQGSDATGLKNAISALTDEEYWDSFVRINGGNQCLIPNDVRSYIRSYFYDAVPSSEVLVDYWRVLVNKNADTIDVTESSILSNPAPSASFQSLKIKGTMSAITVTSWVLYKRKQTLAIPGAGFNYKIVQYKNNNAVTLQASGSGDSTSFSSATLDKVGSDDITGYTAVAITQFSCSKDGVCIRFAGSSPLGIGIVNTRNASITVPVGGVLLSVLYIKL